MLLLDTGWRFDRDGKAFFCDECRQTPSPLASKRCDRVSIKYYKMKNELEPLVCHLCRMPENEVHGELLAFQQGNRQMCCVHLNCVKYTNIVDTFEARQSRMVHEYQNVFDILNHSKICSVCNNMGASIRCTNGHCNHVFHYHCAITKFGWDFRRKGSKRFQCGDHGKNSKVSPSKGRDIVVKEAEGEGKGPMSGLTFQHDLFAQFGGAVKSPKIDIPGNLDISEGTHPRQNQNFPNLIESPNSKVVDDSDGNEISGDDDSFMLEEEDDGQSLEVMDLPLSRDISGPIRLVRLERASQKDFWNISFQIMKINNDIVLTVAQVDSGGEDEIHKNEGLSSLRVKDIIVSINGSEVGSDGLRTLRRILFRLKQEVDLVLEVIRTGL